VRTAASSALYVRDGRIKVSIARIKSGALPSLAGMLSNVFFGQAL
jgi:hypothetical protein